MKRLLLAVLVVFAFPLPLAAAYPSTAAFGATGPLAGFSSVRDFLTGNHHCAGIDMTAGKVIYKLVGPDGTVQSTTVIEQVALTQEAVAGFAQTSVDFDNDSRPVVAYTRFDGTFRSIQVARWNGSAWVHTEVVGGGVISNKLSLALYNRTATAWRLAYVNYAAPSLRLASAGGSDFKVADLLSPPNDAGVDLEYSANSGALVFRDPQEGVLKFGNLADDATNATGIGAVEAVDASANVGAGVYYTAGPGGWPHFVYLDLDSGAVKLARRLPNFSWTHETVIRPTLGALANPTLAFDNDGLPMIACTDTAGDTLRIAARAGGEWFEDVIDLPDFFTKPLFLSPQATGGMRLFAVGDYSNIIASNLRSFGPIDDFIDADHDGVPLRFERAFMMNATLPDREKLPVVSTQSIGGQPRLVITVRQQPGGTASGGHRYESADHILTIQGSSDLQTWVSNSGEIALAEAFTVSGTRFSSSYAIDPVGSADGIRFLRVRVERK